MTPDPSTLRGRETLRPHLRVLSNDDPWMSKRELAEALGFSVRWVEYRVREGMPHRVFGGRLRFQRVAVESWLDERERLSA
jgi:hypothetical protein